MSKIFKGDAGTKLIVDLQDPSNPTLDLTGITVHDLDMKKPDGSAITFHANVVGTSLEYTFQAGELDQSGEWVGQAKVVTPDWSGRGSTFVFDVYEHFE